MINSSIAFGVTNSTGYKDVSSVARTNHQCAKSPTAYISDKGHCGSISIEKFHEYALSAHLAERVATAAWGLAVLSGTEEAKGYRQVTRCLRDDYQSRRAGATRILAMAAA